MPQLLSGLGALFAAESAAYHWSIRLLRYLQDNANTSCANVTFNCDIIIIITHLTDAKLRYAAYILAKAWECNP